MSKRLTFLGIKGSNAQKLSACFKDKLTFSERVYEVFSNYSSEFEKISKALHGPNLVILV